LKKKLLGVGIVLLMILAGEQGCAQKKDSTVQYDTVYFFGQKDIAALKAIIMNSKIIGDDGQPYTGNDLMRLTNWMDSRKTLVPKQKQK
jgi:hypothetical protein